MLSLALLPLLTPGQGALSSGNYPNFFARIGKSDAEVLKRVEATFQQLFYGDDKTQRLYYPIGTDEAYIYDVGNEDVRSEGMSYGMMIAVQLNKRKEFDRLWNWARRHMLYASGPYKGYFAWQCKTDGTILGKTPAPDGEEYFATALFFAANRWKSSEYGKAANAILETMTTKTAEKTEVLDMFDSKEKMVVFVPFGTAATFTDPSYHLPAFYECWAKVATQNRGFWKSSASVSRTFLRKAAHPTTGLFSDYASFEGKAMGAPWETRSSSMNFNFDAWRVAMNIAVDYSWFRADPWQVEQTNRYLNFFTSQGISQYKASYELSGKATVEYRSEGLIATNAAAATISTNKDANDFLRALWDQPTPSGQWRYYNGMLHMLSFLHVSGNFRAFVPRS